MRCLRLSVLLLASGCIEGPEPDSVHSIEPRTCETGVAADQTFKVTGSYELARQDRLRSDPPRFAMDTPDGVIDLATSVGDFGELTLTPQQPLPANADMTLRLVEPRALAGVYLADQFPATYSTRSEVTIRTYRATSRNTFVSFSQPLDAATVAGAVQVLRGSAPVSSTVQYLDSPGHVVHVQITSDDPIEIEFRPSLRTKAGQPVFEVPAAISVDPTYTLPPSNGCETAE